MFGGGDPWDKNNKGKEQHRDHGGGDASLEDYLASKFFSLISKFLKGLFGKGGGGSGGGKKDIRLAPFLVLLVVLVLVYASSGFYSVKEGEQSLELIFGKYVASEGAGLHYNLPMPFGKVFKVKVMAINREDVGVTSTSSDQQHGEGVILTGDENIVSVHFEIQWKISDPKKYLFNLRDNFSGAVVKSAAESAMRDVIGRKKMNFVLEGVGRAVVASEAQTLLQKILDSYGSGISVVSIQLKRIDPPEQVLSAFRDVQSARADKERIINEAQAYRNSIIPKAEGESVRRVAAAEGRRGEMIDIAEGDCSRLMLIYKEYSKNPSIFKDRVYLETMEKVYKKGSKVIIGDNSGAVVPYFKFFNAGDK